jgi:indolepyruvate ferredoxin oxidoreductase, beta subunit
MNDQNRSVLNIIFTGVGGQGSILASHLLTQAYLSQGQEVKLAETFGGATRGGSVLAHIRVGLAWSPVIPKEEADFVVAMEPLEGFRVALQYLKPKGQVILNTHPWYPQGVTLGSAEYPSMEKILEALNKIEVDTIVLCATEMATKAGNARSANIVMLGALVALAGLEAIEENLFKAMGDRWPDHVQIYNQKAYQLGRQFIREGGDG